MPVLFQSYNPFTKAFIMSKFPFAQVTTGKTEPSQQCLLEEKLTFQKNISGAIFYHDIPKNYSDGMADGRAISCGICIGM